jgi:hypothetical protein
MVRAFTEWYVLSPMLCAVSVLFFYIYENSRAIQSTPLGGMTGTIAVTFMTASMDVREGIYILLTAGALLILPQNTHVRSSDRRRIWNCRNDRHHPSQQRLRPYGSGEPP